MMRRTQLYLDDQIWKVLHIESRQRRTSISDLVRSAMRERYGFSPTNRRKAMKALAGMRRDRQDLRNTDVYIRRWQRAAPEKDRFLKSILIDSDILIEVSRGHDAAILSKWDDLSRGAWHCSARPSQ